MVTAIDDVLSGRKAQNYEADGSWLPFHHIYSFEVIKDGYVTGMMAVYMDDDILQVLRNSMLKTSIGKTGYIWVIGTKGESRGRYIVSNSPTE